MAESDGSLPLDGSRVVEIGGGIAAAYASRLLAGFGADVVRVEGLATGPPLTEAEEIYLVAGKRRVDAAELDLRSLALTADIIVEDAPPGRLVSLGIDPLELRAARPPLVVVSVSPFGQTGPYRSYKATNLVSFAMGGIMSLTGELAKAPLVTGGSQAQYLGGLHTFAAAVTTHLGAVRHGEGDWIDLSLQECAAGMLELYGPWVAFGSAVLPRMGNQTRAEWGIYPCLDGYIGIFTLQRQVPALFAAMEDPELIEGPFLDSIYRLEHPEELAAKIYQFTLSHTKDELMAIGRQRRVPIGVALSPAELLDATSLAERGFWDEVSTDDGSARVPGRPFTGLGWRALDRLSRPGEDSSTVAKEWLT